MLAVWWLPSLYFQSTACVCRASFARRCPIELSDMIRSSSSGSSNLDLWPCATFKISDLRRGLLQMFQLPAGGLMNSCTVYTPCPTPYVCVSMYIVYIYIYIYVRVYVSRALNQQLGLCQVQKQWYHSSSVEMSPFAWDLARGFHVSPFGYRVQ